MVVAVIVLLRPTSGEASAMEPGLWRYEMQTQVTAVPFTMPTITTRACLDANDIRYGVVFSDEERKAGCRFGNRQVEGQSVSYELACPGDEPVSGRFSFFATADTVDGQGLIDADGAQIQQRWVGERLGDC